MTTTYISNCRTSVQKFFLLLIIMVMGVGSVWAQTVSTWEGTEATKFASGSGTQADPYIISNAAELAYFGSQMNGKSWYVKLAADIDLNNREWTYGKNSATNFKGHFDGGGHTISNLKVVPGSAKNNGFFSSLQGTNASRAEVKNLIIDGVTISQTADLAKTTTSGALAGNVTEYTDIANVTVKNVSVTFVNLTGENFVGGFVGRVQQNNCQLTRCSVVSPTINISGNISGGASYIGGAIAYLAGSNNLLSTINGLTVKSPSVTINKVAIKDCYIGAVFGRLNTYFTADDIEVSDPILTYNDAGTDNVALNLGSLAGGFGGNTTKEVSITNVTVTGTAQLTLGTDNTEVMSVKAGLIGYATTNVRLEGWTVEKTNVQVYGKLTTGGSQIGAFAGNLAGAAGGTTIVNNITIGDKDGTEPGASIDITGDVKIGCSIGGFVGQMTTNSQLRECTVYRPTIALNSDITTASFIGGAIGDFLGTAGNTSYITGLFSVISPSVIINKNSVANTFVGATFGRIRDYSNVRNVTVSNPTLTYNNADNPNFDTYLGTFAGNIIGNSAQEIVVSDISVTGNAALTIGTSGNISKIRAGIIGQATTNARLENWQVENSTVTANGDLATNSSYLGGFAGTLTSATGAPLTLTNVKVKNSTVTPTGNINVASYIGGFSGQTIVGDALNAPIFIDNCGIEETTTITISNGVTKGSFFGGFTGYLWGRDKGATTYIQASNVSVGTANITITGATDEKSYYGGLVGYVYRSGSLNNWTIAASNLTIGAINAESYVGGAFGHVNGSTNYAVAATGINVSGLNIRMSGNLTKPTYVGGVVGRLEAIATTPNKIEKSTASGSISTTGNYTFTPGNTAYAFGGIVGYTEQNAGANVAEINNCVSEVNFNLSGFSSSSTDGDKSNLYSGFVIGGVIGRIHKPSRLPESLYYSGKIYAPFAVVGPIVGTFSNNVGADAYAYDDYCGLNATAVSTEWDVKAQNWYYNGYKLGLSQTVIDQTERTKNYKTTPVDDDGIKYLSVEDVATTFTEQNTISGSGKSYTVLVYNVNNKDQDKGIYPKWTANSATYPAYYMYYMQGVNRGNFVADDQSATIKAQVLSGAFALLTLKDANADITQAANRGFISHALTATASSADSFKWYVDGVEQSATTANFAITPAFKGNTVAVEAIKDGKAIKRVDCKVKSVLRVTDASAAVGTKTNPYLIGSAEELQFMSYLSTLPLNTTWEKTYTSDNHYNKAYYELDGDVDLSGVADFTPISFATGFVANGAMSLGYVFDGVFDGKQHKISGMKEEWYGGAINGKDSYLGWGLFSVVGNPVATTKVGDSQASPAAIRNLIIDGATLTHRTSNTTFNYNEINAVDKFNNVGIGVLAGVVLNNTNIDNIEIRNSQITDEGSSNYSLATGGLYVGGAVGSIQNSFNEQANAPVNTKIQHVAAQVDITLEHPTFADATKEAQLGLFNIGGIIGRYCATSALQDQAQASMPAYTLYSGSVNASNAWISPILGATRFTGQNDVSKFANYSKIWEGNNNSDATQLTITNAQYYNFRINGELMTELYPEEACARGARPVEMHTDAVDALADYNAAKYQGVNYNARFIDSEGTTLYFLNQNPVDGIYWVWENGFPHMTDQNPNDSYLTRAVNEFTANLEEGTGSSYRWLVSYDGETWTEVDELTQQTSSILASARRKLVVAIITIGGTEYRTQAELVDAVELHFAPYIRQSGDDASGYVLTIVWNGEEPSGILSATYQWYHSDKTAMFDGETGTILNLTKAQLDAETDGLVWCAVTIREMGDEVVTIFVKNTATVVYVNGNGYTGNGAGVGIDTNDGRTPQTPVKTIDKANSLLDGGPLDKNIIVVMGTLNTAEFRSKGTKPATLTGRWDGIDYEGIITIGKTSGEDVLNKGNQPDQNGLHNYVKADTKFEYLTFNCASNTADNNFIECHGNDVWFGKGLVMTNFRNLSKNHGNLDAAQNIPELTIVLTATNLNEADLQKYIRTDLRTGNNRSKPQTLTIESGHYGRIMGGRFTNKFFSLGDNTSHTILGSTRYPLWAIVNIDIDKDNPNKGTIERGEDPNKGTVTDNFTLDINCIIAGLTDGTMYGDYTINVHGGKIGYIVGGNQGNPVPNGSKTFAQPGGNSGNWGQWPNSTYLGRTIINVEQDSVLKDITIANLYAGGLGREANGEKATSVVDMYMYGHTEINMKSGTVTGNVYGGGAGGVIGINPWDMHVPYATTESENADFAIMNGVQYGEWGAKKAGSPLANVTLHDSDDNGGYTTKLLNLGESYTTLNISGGTINGSVYGGGCGYVSNMPKEVVMQGVGSVFGTSNVNISGGTVHGSVYGGSEGSNKYYGAVNKYGQTINHIAEMNGTVNLKISGTDSQYPTIDGNIYGAGMGIASKSASEEYLRIATAGNYDLAGPGATEEQKNKYKTDINITIDMPESIEFPNDIYGGGALGKVDGTTNIILKRGKFTGSIYGGGYGELQHLDKAMVTGTTNIYTGDSVFTAINRSLPVTILPIDTRIPTIYGGGNMAQITGNTYINLYHGNITADVFGGGKGLTQSQSGTFTDYGKVTGNTRVLYNNITEDNKLTGNIYGGGALGDVVGQGEGDDKGTTVVIKDGEVIGDVFGGGKGEVGSDKAKVTGNTNVIVDSNWKESEPAPDPAPVP